MPCPKHFIIRWACSHVVRQILRCLLYTLIRLHHFKKTMWAMIQLHPTDTLPYFAIHYMSHLFLTDSPLLRCLHEPPSHPTQTIKSLNYGPLLFQRDTPTRNAIIVTISMALSNQTFAINIEDIQVHNDEVVLLHISLEPISSAGGKMTMIKFGDSV